MSSQIETAAKLYERGDFAAADSLCCHIIQQNKNPASAIHLRGVIAYQSKDYSMAIDQLTTANELIENNGDIMFALAASYEYTQQYAQAITLYQKIRGVEPENTIVRKQLAGVYIQNDQHAEALNEYLTLNKLIGDDPTVLLAISEIYVELGTFKKATLFLDKLNSLPINDPSIHNNLGLIYKTIGEYETSITCFKQAISLDRNNHSSQLNLASLLQDLGRFEEAKIIYHDILNDDNADDKQCSRVHYNLALIHLGNGEFSNAWNYLLQRPKFFPYTPTLREIVGKKLLVVGEEGMGDELMFLRFIPSLKEQVKSIDYVGNKKLHKLLKQIISIDHFHEKIPDTKKFDYCISIMDVPIILGLTEIGNTPPLQLTPNKALTHPIIDHLSSECHAAVLGITWEAGINADDNKEKYLEKSIPIDIFSSVIKNFTGTIVILQRNPREEDLQYLMENVSANVIDASSINNDLDLMLTLLSNIDHYIGVSNTNMHLFGSLGKKCDVIIPYPSEWRWMYENISSPWYSAFNLYRQESRLDWDFLKNMQLQYLK